MIPYEAYALVSDEYRKKLDPKSGPCIFISYCESSKAYKFYNAKTHKVVGSRDVDFDEGGVYSHQNLYVDDRSNGVPSSNMQNVQPSSQSVLPSSPTSPSNSPREIFSSLYSID